MSTTMACECWGELALAGDHYVCLACGESTPLGDHRTELDCDLFEIEQGKCTALELEPMPWGGRDRGDWDALDDKIDLQPFTRTTRY